MSALLLRPARLCSVLLPGVTYCWVARANRSAIRTSLPLPTPRNGARSPCCEIAASLARPEMAVEGTRAPAHSIITGARPFHHCRRPPIPSLQTPTHSVIASEARQSGRPQRAAVRPRPGGRPPKQRDCRVAVAPRNDSRGSSVGCHSSSSYWALSISTTAGSANVVVSPRARPSATSRSRRRMILPLRVLGNSAAK